MEMNSADTANKMEQVPIILVQYAQDLSTIQPPKNVRNQAQNLMGVCLILMLLPVSLVKLITTWMLVDVLKLLLMTVMLLSRILLMLFNVSLVKTRNWSLPMLVLIPTVLLLIVILVPRYLEKQKLSVLNVIICSIGTVVNAQLLLWIDV